MFSATLLWRNQTLALTIILECGADERFIDQGGGAAIGVEAEMIDSPVQATILNGNLLTRVECRTVWYWVTRGSSDITLRLTRELGA